MRIDRMSTPTNSLALAEILDHLERQPNEKPPRLPSGPSKLKALTLKQASFLSQESEEVLLQEGELGNLTFFIRVPAAAVVRLFNERTGETGEPPLMRTPNVLALDRQAFTEFRAWGGRAHVGTARLGAGLNEDGDQFRLMSPSDCEPRIAHTRETSRIPRWTHWKVAHRDGTSLEVDAHTAFVFRSDVTRHFNLDLKPYGQYDSENESGEVERHENFKSNLLQYANQAAYLFWGRSVDERDTSTYPDTERIVEWLRGMDEDLSESLAKSIAAIIRPDFAPSTRVSRQPKELRDPPRRKKTSR
jgi:hypothetical protein